MSLNILNPTATVRHSILAAAVILLLLAAGSVRASIIISEVDPTGSSNANYGADWYELTNTGATAQDITGWKMDDNSNSFSLAVPLRGVTSIAAGQSVVFVEGTATGTTDATIDANFESAWFGASVPAGFTIGNYGGSGVGLSSSSDAVNIFDSSGDPITGVTFGASTSGVSFDNAAGVNGAISTLSSVGVNGAFMSPDGEIGSPGVIANAVVPEPSAFVLAAFGLVAGLGLAFHRRAAAAA